ncbi:ROK family transcriptional regulator [Microbacterium tumbae]
MPASSLARGFNRSAILSALLDAGEIDRPRLVAETGVSQATVFRVVESLVQEGIVLEGDQTRQPGPGRGRGATLLQVDPGYGIAVGVDLGGTNCRVVLTDALGRTLGRRHDRTPGGLDGSELADWLAGHIFELAVRYGGGAELGSVAIGLPGAVSGDKERVVNSVNLPQIIGTEFIESLGEATGVPTVVDNDSNLALLGELMYGSGNTDDTLAMIILGTGLSAAVSIEGTLLSGRDGALGEFGRLPLGDGHRVRDLLSGAGLTAFAKENGHPVQDARELFEHPDEYRPILDRVHETLQHLITVIVLAYQPQAVLVAGGFSGSFDDALLDTISRKVDESVGVLSPIRRSALGDDAGLYGAMSLALSNFYLEMGVNRDDVATIRGDVDEIVRAFRACTPDSDVRAGEQR